MPETVKMKIGSQVYEIPGKYVLPGLPPEMTGDPEQLDTTDLVSLFIPLLDVGIEPDPELQGIRSDFRHSFLASLHEGGPSGSLEDLYKPAYDAWMGNGLHKKRVIEPNAELGLCKIYRNDRKLDWHYFKTCPGKGVEPEWVADCDASNCVTARRMPSNVFEVTIHPLYLDRIDAIVNGVRSLIMNWER